MERGGLRELKKKQSGEKKKERKKTTFYMEMDSLEDSFCITVYVELCRERVARLKWEPVLMHRICMRPHSWLLDAEEIHSLSCTVLVIDWQEA